MGRNEDMAMTQNPIAIGVFTTEEQARHAIDDLHQAGFSDEEIGYLTRVAEADTGGGTDESVATGAVGGGILGGILGATAALLIPGVGPVVAGGILAATLGGIVLGAAAGGLIGTLTDLGFSQDEARFYQRELEQGHTVVTVKSEDGATQAAEILHRDGAYDARTPFSQYNAPPRLRPRANEERPLD
jgi:hypothetical protein